LEGQIELKMFEMAKGKEGHIILVENDGGFNWGELVVVQYKMV
jgi:hypothetical protein